MRRLPICLLPAVWLASALGPSWGNEPPAARAKRPPVREDLRPSAGSVIRLGTARYLNVGKVFSVAFSPDSKILASASWDGSIRLWEVATGKELRQRAGHTGWIKALAFSPDGQLLA